MGLTYKQQGLPGDGNRTGAGTLWLPFSRSSQRPQGGGSGPGKPLRLYCWRGGMRSYQQPAWLASLSDHPGHGAGRGVQVIGAALSPETSWPCACSVSQQRCGKQISCCNPSVMGLPSWIRKDCITAAAVSEISDFQHNLQQRALRKQVGGTTGCVEHQPGAPEIWLEAEHPGRGRCRIPGWPVQPDARHRCWRFNAKEQERGSTRGLRLP